MNKSANRSFWLLVVIGVLTGPACGGGKSSTGSSPSAPTPVSSTGPGTTNPTPTPPAPAPTQTCRTYPTAATVTTVSQGVSMNALLTGAFNTSNNTSTITTMFANGTPCTTSVMTYRSTADFVDEVRVIPGLPMQTSTTTTNMGACGSGTQMVSYSYDSQRRLTSFTTSGGTTTYTAWDSSGRATAGSFPGTTITNVYNDSTRTWTQTHAQGTTTTTSTMTFDANGNQLMNVITTNGAQTSTVTYTNTATAQVCK